MKDLVISELNLLIEKLRYDRCEMTEEEAMNLLKSISHEALTLEQSCDFLGISRSKFLKLIDEGIIPKGIKRRGWKELTWYKDELTTCMK